MRIQRLSKKVTLTLIIFHPDEPVDKWGIPDPTAEEIDDAVKHGQQMLGERDILEESIRSPIVDSPSFRHQKSIGSTPEARSMSKRGLVEVTATEKLAKGFHKKSNKTRTSIGRGKMLNVGEVKADSMCKDIDPLYRTANGTCNSKLQPEAFGVANRPFRRHLNPHYGDGINSPRNSITGGDLPSARKVSLGVHRPSYQTDPHFTVMLAVWGQFLDHDITATAAVQGQNGQPIECCGTEATKHPDCFPVALEAGDPYFDYYNVSCMNFVRSAAAPTGHLGPRQQLNQATPVIDGSVVYGSSEDRMNLLRSQNNGQLRMFNTPDNRTLLPVNTDPKDGCNELSQNLKGRYCFESGDTRANENLHLTSMHLIWARQHNAMAEGLAKVNPHWDDERLFQEARKIVGAQMQHIHYNEFLPVLLGTEYSKEVGISPNSTQPNEDTYDPYVDPTVSNGFAAAAFRFAHTLLPSLFKVTRNKTDPEGIELHKLLFNPYSLWQKRGVDDAIGSAINTNLGRTDPFVTTELTEKLFASTKTAKPCGLDLVSLNIQRGRDHGLPAYPEWRIHCGLPAINTWADMKGAVDDDSLKRMQEIYSDPLDIDVYTGALSEPPQGDAIVGPLLQCLITDQFVRLKKGDSFWYERNQGVQRFSRPQLAQIYETTLAAVLCRNSDEVDRTQRFVMRTEDQETNPTMMCSELDRFQFDLWVEKEKSSFGNSAMHFLRLFSQGGANVNHV